MAIPEAIRSGFGRFHFFYVEIDFERCANTYGVAPCTATGAVGNECVNCRLTCQDPVNFIAGTPKTLRLIPKDCVGVPIGFEGHPCLIKCDIDHATELAMGDGLSSRERLAISAMDFLLHDREMDPYWSTRATSAVGTFFGRHRARNEYYSGFDVRYYDGYIVNGAIDAANFDVRSYVLDQYDRPSAGLVNMIARDALMLGNEKSAKAPAVSIGALASDITDTALSLTLGSGQGKDYRLEENLFVASGDFSDAAWTNSGITVTTNAGNDIHGNAVADNLSDASAVATGSISQAASDYTVSEPYVMAVDIEKDAIGRATRFMVLRIEHAGSTTETSEIALDTSTGDTDITTSTGAVGGVDDYGTHWRLWISVASSDVSNTSCSGYLLPAAGASATWVRSVAATGSINASRPQIERNSSPWDYIETTIAAVKNGMQVRIGDEIIKVTGRAGDVLSWPDTTYRGQWGTTAGAHSTDDNVQWCLDVTGLNVVRAIQRELIFFTRMSPARIPFTSWEAERTGKMLPWIIDIGIVSKPEGVLNLIASQAADSMTNIWMDTLLNSVLLQSLQPQPVDTELNERDHIINKPVEMKDMPDKRASMVVVNFGLWDVLNPTKAVSYGKTLTRFGNPNYGSDQIDEIFCRWFDTQSAATVLAFRRAIMRGDMPVRAMFDLDDKDGALGVGEAIDLVTDAMPDPITGATQLNEMIIVSKKPMRAGGGVGRRYAMIAEKNPYTGNYGVIAPNGTPLYRSASEYQKQRYSFISYNGGVSFPDGKTPKQIT